MATNKFFQEQPQPARAISDGEDKDKHLVSKIKRWKEDSGGWVSAWETNQVKWHKLRMRIKKTKTFPFVGCSNLRMPTIETKIRKLKSALVNVIFGIRPIVQAIPTPKGSWDVARKIEKFLDHLVMDVMKLKPKAIIGIDQSVEKGFYLLKPYWRTEVIERHETMNLDDVSMEEAQWLFSSQTTPEMIAQALIDRLQIDTSDLVADYNQPQVEKAVSDLLTGKDSIDLKVKDVLYNFPDVDLCPPERVYVPTTSGYNPQSCAYIIHEFFLPIHVLKQNVKNKGWYNLPVAEIDYKKSLDLNDKTIDVKKDEREGIERLQSEGELVKVWECYCWSDLKGKGCSEKSVITVAPDFDKVLRKISLPFYSGKFPFVKFFYELLEDRWFSHRGIPELIEDVVKEIDIQHMQKIDYGTINNSPMFIYRAGQINKSTMQFVFGQGIAAQGMQPLDDIVKPFNRNNPNVEFSYEREQMLLETKIEELIGQVDFTLHSMINKRQPRTLGEVQMQQQNMQQVFSLDADMFRMQFEELLNWIWELWCQYGSDEYEFNYFGKDIRGGFETIKLSKEEIQNKYTITVRGNDQNTNPQVRLQKAQMVMMAQQNQIAVQMGVVTPQNVANALKLFYQELDVPQWEGLVTDPQPMPPPPPQVRMKMDDLTDAEQAQVLAKQGIQPDVQGRMLQAQDEEEDAAFEQFTELADTLGKIGGKNERKAEIGGR